MLELLSAQLADMETGVSVLCHFAQSHSAESQFQAQVLKYITGHISQVR